MARKQRTIKIDNRSRWPDEFVDVLVPWICAEAGIDFPYSVQLAPKGWGGTGGRYRQRTHCVRRKRPGHTKDGRMKHSERHELRSSVEWFIYIVAHEAYHATKGHPTEFRKGSRTDVQSMEWWCNHWAYNIVIHYRLNRRKLMAQVKRNLRRTKRARQAKERQQERVQAAKDHRKTDDYKLVNAQRLLKQWEAKRKLAATKVKKYRNRIRHLERKAAKVKDSPAQGA